MNQMGFATLEDIRNLAAQCDSIVFRYVFREANFVGDWLADFVFSVDLAII